MTIKPTYEELGQKIVELEKEASESKLKENLFGIQRDLSMALNTVGNLNDGLGVCLEAALKASGMDCGGVYLLDEISGALDMVYHDGLPPDFIKNSSHYDSDMDNVKLILAGESVYTQHQELGISLREAERQEHLRAIAVLPISYHNQVIGCLNVASHSLEEVPFVSRSALESIAAQIGGGILRLQAEEALRKKSYALNERVKELTGVYNLSRLIEEKEDLPQVLQGTVDLIPDSWQYPDITCARLMVEGRSYTTKNYEDTAWSLSRDLVVATRKIGTLDVGYLEERPKADEGPFLKEEVSLLTVIAERLQSVIERKEAEEARQMSEATLNAILSSAQDAIYMLDFNSGERRYVNPAMADMLGYSTEELMSMGFQDTVDPETAAMLRDIGRKMIVERKAVRGIEYEIIRKDGSRITVSSTIAPLIAEDRITDIVGVIRDVTERKRGEEALRESEEKYRGHLDNLADMFYQARVFRPDLSETEKEKVLEFVDAIRKSDEADLEAIYDRAVKELVLDVEKPYTDGTITLSNQTAEKLLGYSLDELGKITFGNIISPEHAEIALRNAFTIFRNGFQNELEYDLMKTNGERIPVSINARLSLSEFPYAIEGVVRDITERKRAKEALGESQEKYRIILESMEEGYYEVDLAGNFTFANDAMCRIRSMSRDELMGTNNREHMIPETAKEVYEAFNKVYTTGEPARNLEYGTIGEDGEIIYVETSASLIKASGGEPTGFRGVVRDVTERRRDREEKREMEAQLQQAQKMESIGTLAGGIAHDFNNALYSIIGYTELTMDDMPEDSLAQENLKEVLNGALRAKDMVKQILAFSRKADTVKKPIKVQSVVSEALKFLRTSIPTTIEIRQNIDDDCGPILADSTQIHQVVMNLATNAYQAMREKGGVLELTLMEEQIGSDDSGLDLKAGTYLKLTVSDTGHGINEAVIEKIFDPYFTTKGPGEGTGMGLAVVHGIVKDHGGDIKVYSKLGEGTTFSVYLPMVESRPVEQKTIAAEFAATGTERILFVDDEEALVFMTQQILERLGYQVTSRTSSVEALEAFKAKPDEYDLVITDMTMPNMTGVELSARLREIRPDIPIILCTGFSEMIDEDKAKNMGISAYIMKPILKDEIGGAIRKVLDKGN